VESVEGEEGKVSVKKVVFACRIVWSQGLTLAGLLVAIVALASTFAAEFDTKAWEGSTNPETKERFINLWRKYADCPIAYGR
jgi:hypothetical protein